jgi:hypothetical protein
MMADQIIGVHRVHLHPTVRGDRGCVFCGRRINDGTEERLIVDARGRYWCLCCAASSLANVRRSRDERNEYAYPWRFEDVGPDGQIGILTPDEIAAVEQDLAVIAAVQPLSAKALMAIAKLIERVRPKAR